MQPMAPFENSQSLGAGISKLPHANTGRVKSERKMRYYTYYFPYDGTFAPFLPPASHDEYYIVFKNKKLSSVTTNILAQCVESDESTRVCHKYINRDDGHSLGIKSIKAAQQKIKEWLQDNDILILNIRLNNLHSNVIISKHAIKKFVRVNKKSCDIVEEVDAEKFRESINDVLRRFW